MTLPTPPEPVPPARGTSANTSKTAGLRVNPRTIQFTDAHIEMPSAFIEAICDWCKRHGIDPNQAVVPGVLIADETRRRVYYHAPRPGHDGMHLAVHPHVVDQCRELTYVQLEAPPLDWPPEVERYCYVVDNGDGDVAWVTGPSVREVSA